jgi:hypothetical protein
MGPIIDNVKDNIDAIISFVGEISDQSTIGIIEYGHNKFIEGQISGGEPIRVLPPTDVSTENNIATIKNAVNTLKAGGFREPHGAATTMAIDDLRTVVGSGRNKIVVLITDEPFGAGGESLAELNQAAEYAKQNDISIIGVHVGLSYSDIFDFLIMMAETSSGAAVKQGDGMISEPLIKLLTRYCMITGITSIIEVENPNECDESANADSIAIAIDLKRKQEQTPYTFVGNIFSSSTEDNEFFIHNTDGDPFYWQYVAPGVSLLYGTRPNGVGNWLNYPPSPRQGISMNEAKWIGHKLKLDVMEEGSLMPCAPTSFTFIDGLCNIVIPTFTYDSAGKVEILRCLPVVTINTNINLSTIQTVKIEGASGGYYYFRDKVTCELSEKVWWDSNDSEITRILQSMPSFGVGNVVAIGSNTDYEIRFSPSLGLIPGIEIISYPYLTCTDQDITVVDDPPYNYFKPKPLPSSIIPTKQCSYCSYEEELYNFRTISLNYNCVKNTKSLVCRVSKPSFSYTKYIYDNGNIMNIDDTYVPKPGDNIILIDDQLGDHRKFTNKISRSVVN